MNPAALARHLLNVASCLDLYYSAGELRQNSEALNVSGCTSAVGLQVQHRPLSIGAYYGRTALIHLHCIPPHPSVYTPHYGFLWWFLSCTVWYLGW